MYLAISLMLFSCKASKVKEDIIQKEANDLPKIEETYYQRMERIFDEIVGSINGLYPSHGNNFWREDKYGNEYLWDSDLRKIGCSIHHSPDLEVIIGLQNYIHSISIYTGEGYSSTITDISFLEHLPQLRALYIRNGENIEVFDTLKYLVSLERLEIGDSYRGTFDCSILDNLKNLRNLVLLIDDLANRKTIFSLPNLEEIWLSDYFTNTADFTYYYNEGYGTYYESQKASPAYQYELGKYHLSQYRANIRTEPSRDGDVLALLHLNDEVEILENSWMAEKINDVWGLWYKIIYGDIVGYTFGGNIAEHTFVTDIDKNGINDYFYCRESSSNGIRAETDIIIYINNQRINTSALAGEYNWMWVRFEEKDDYVLMVLSSEGGDTGSWQGYKVTPDGRIEKLDDDDWWDY
jgi:hypothetical protein